MDPLLLLRDFCINKQLDKIEVKNDRIKFGEKFTFLKSMPTAYKSQLGKGDFYSVETILYFLKFFYGGKGSSSFSDYMQNARSAGLAHVSRVDRKVRLQAMIFGPCPHSFALIVAAFANARFIFSWEMQPRV